MYPVLSQIGNFEIRSYEVIVGFLLLRVWLSRKETAGASNTAMEAVNLVPGWKEGVS